MGSHEKRLMKRRDWLVATSLGAGGMMLARPTTLPAAADPRVGWAPPSPDLTPKQALERLLEGNRRFAEGKPIAPNRSMARLREVAPDQKPFAAVLSCADSRVPVELLFDQGFGDLFVVRVAGNVVTPEEMASLEFGTLVLGAKVIYVLGHSGCGAIKAAMAGTPVPGQISVLFQHLRSAVRAGMGDLAKATEANVRVQVGNLTESSTVLSGLIKEGKLSIAGGVYQLSTGAVEPVAIA